MLLLIHHEFILKNLVYCMLGERALVRNFWMTNYHQHWFETIWRLRRHQFVSKFFKCEFRVTPDTFEFILQLVNRSMSRDNTIFRDAIGIEKRVGIALWRLSTGNSYRTIAKVFSVSPPSVNRIVLEFCTVLNMIAGDFIKFPDNELATRQQIQKLGCPIPQVVSIIDGTHIKIKCPDIPSKSDLFQ